MMSKNTARLIELLPEKLVVKIARNKINGYLKKYAKINVSGYENIEKKQMDLKYLLVTI